ncbi:MAG: lytic transglycosylase domain-containing protein [Maritimibacter sp.]
MRRALTTISFALWAAVFLAFAGHSARAQDADDVARLRSALALMASGDWDGARQAAGPTGSVPSDIIEWNRLRAGQGTFGEALAFLDRRPDWPGEALLRKRSEKSIPDEPTPAAVIDFFLHDTPQTGWGSLRMAAALWQTGAKQEAMAEARRGWTTLSLSSAEEAAFMEDWPKTLKAHHWERLDMLLWAGETKQAERQMARVDLDHQLLARARIALRKNEDGVNALIDKVPAALKSDPGLAYERMLWRANKGLFESTAELILERSKSAASLGQPARWGYHRLDLARRMMREGESKTAYQLAASHQISEGRYREDAEWLAGYIALRKLNDAATAREHFMRFRASVDTPISLGRAGYWEGRAEEALGNTEAARVAYAFGAEHQTSYYGQLAAEKAGILMAPSIAGREVFPDYKAASFWNLPIMEAARLSLAANNSYLAERFAVHLSERLNRAETGALADWARDAGSPHVEHMIGKHAVRYDKMLEAAYFPTPEIGAGNPSVPRALELSIARRESQFDPSVSSGVGASGLMQLMPGTAKDMASRVGVEYSAAKLTDMSYNTRLGSEYLAWLMERYGNNPVLISVGYNAGPGRANSWQRDRGDPRSANVDVVDWVEHIPFDETRNYVMRVSESLLVYRARRSGEPQPMTLSKILKQP